MRTICGRCPRNEHCPGFIVLLPTEFDVLVSLIAIYMTNTSYKQRNIVNKYTGQGGVQPEVNVGHMCNSELFELENYQQ